MFLAPSVGIPLNVVMNEHRMYLPMIAVALLSGAALARVAETLGARHGAVRAWAAMAVPFACCRGSRGSSWGPRCRSGLGVSTSFGAAGRRRFPGS